jgi:2-haloacid dehalogenase
MTAPLVDALLFDVFGTVVDWRGTIVREGRELGRAHGIDVDWEAFAQDWHADGYQGGLARIRRGELPMSTVASLHRRKLDELLTRFGLTALDDLSIERFNRVWRRLEPWPDALAGLARLKKTYIIAPLSNGDFGMLVDLARHDSLPWDCIFAAEQFGNFKPDPSTYDGAVALLGLPPERVMLVAAHAYDLYAARDRGLRTAYVPRPAEHAEGYSREPDAADATSDFHFDIRAADFATLADQLGA